MASFLALNGVEIVNAARLKSYVDHGLSPNKYEVRCTGCEGLTGIIPLISSAPPECGYQLPELDDAPWYDPAVPESKDFAGLLVTSATVSAPYSRVTTPNIGEGQVLGRQKLNGRTIVITGWLIGRTCCATSYGLSWLSSAIGDSPCDDKPGCGGGDLDFLSCCPELCQDEGCFRTCVDDDTDCISEIYVRPHVESEWQRGTDFFRTFRGAGVVDGPNILDCQGTSCGCGCGSLLNVEFTLATSKPYAYHPADSIVKNLAVPDCTDACAGCGITWVTDCGTDGPCGSPADCTDDPDCPFPALPPAATGSIPLDQCGCITMCVSTPLIVPVDGERKFGSSVLNIDVAAGSSVMRNLRIYLLDNPTDGPCSDLASEECEAFGSVLIDYVPAGGTLHFNGEQRTLTIECADGTSRDAGRNVTDVSGLPFAWPEITCDNICVKFLFDCVHTAADATISIDRVDRDL